jgi:hypothetical protein
MPGLHYIGNGGALPDVPARDMLDAEVLIVLIIAMLYDRAALLASGLYEEVA